MRATIILIVLSYLGFLTGCANNERYYSNVYEGLKTKAANDRPIPEPGSAERSMTYPEYDSERKKLLDHKVSP